MEVLLYIFGAWVLGSVVIGIFKGLREGQESRSTTTRRREPHSTTPQPRKRNEQTFRPSARPSSTPKITFGESSLNSNKPSTAAALDLNGLHDAFTGAPLNKSLGLHQCQSCKVFYHTESLQILREANGSQCVACQSTNILAIVTVEKSTTGTDYTPNIVTLSTYKQHVGSVVTFEGYVHKVNESRRGDDFAVMFEQKSWTKGFKLVFFKGAVRKVGGKRFINSLQGKKVRVRGLVVNHPTFGYEIIVSEKSMILSVK